MERFLPPSQATADLLRDINERANTYPVSLNGEVGDLDSIVQTTGDVFAVLQGLYAAAYQQLRACIGKMPEFLALVKALKTHLDSPDVPDHRYDQVRRRVDELIKQSSEA